MNKLSASEAVYGFAAWLTTREERTVMSSSDECSTIADLVDEFCKANNLDTPRGNYYEWLVHPSGRRK